MRNFRYYLSLGLALFLYSTSTIASTPVPAPPTIAASGHLLVDMASGQVLAENDADQRLEPASLTKIMTAYVVFKELQEGNVKLEDEVRVSKKAWQTPGSRMFIEVGKQIPLLDLLKGMIIQSGNDASVALAEHIAGSEETFATMMNTQAQRLGMNNTHFTNSTGLPDEYHYTTPRDITLVTAATIREFPEYYKWYAVKEYTFNNIKQHNRNQLLWRDDSVDGVKTGHTDAAGYCLVASAKRDDMRLISAVMGTDGEAARARESLALLNYGFRFFETHRLYAGKEALSDVRTWKGERKKLKIGPAEDVFVTINRGQYDSMEAKMLLEPIIVAPVRKGDVLGHVSIRLGDQELTRTPLVALQEVPEGGLWTRLIDSALLWLE